MLVAHLLLNVANFVFIINDWHQSDSAWRRGDPDVVSPVSHLQDIHVKRVDHVPYDERPDWREKGFKRN